MAIQDFLRTKISFIGKDISNTGLFSRKIYFCMENNSRALLYSDYELCRGLSILSGDERHYLLSLVRIIIFSAHQHCCQRERRRDRGHRAPRAPPDLLATTVYGP